MANEDARSCRGTAPGLALLSPWYQIVPVTAKLVITGRGVPDWSRIGDVVTVRAGYARNFLLPRKLAEMATPARIAQVRKTMEERAAQARREAERAGRP